MVDDIAVQEFVNAIKETPTDTNKTYVAYVSRVDNEGVVWVNIHGSNKETPTASVSTEVNRGDVVNVEWRNNKLYIAGNVTNPSAGVTRVISAEKDAARAFEAANNAELDATRAQEAADRAEAEAERAYSEAERATGYANDALTQLGVVEEVVDVLSWIAEHGTYKKSADTTVVDHKMYFTLTGTVVVPETYDDGTKKITNLESYYEKVNNVYVKTADTTYNQSKTYYTVSAELIENPTGSPSANNYYEIFSIDKAVQNYISSHLALTDSGLWVVKDNQGHKLLLAADGTYLYDDTGHIVATFGATEIAMYRGTVKRMELTGSALKFRDDLGNQRLQLDSSNGVIAGRLDRGRAQITDAGMTIYSYDSTSQTTSDVAYYGQTARIGKDNQAKVVVQPSGVDMYGYNANASPSQTLMCHIGYDNGNAESGQAIAPYYTFGTRTSGSTVGNYSVAVGYDATASGYDSVAGGLAVAEGVGSIAFGGRLNGNATTASGFGSVAIGTYCRSSGSNSMAIGMETQSTNGQSFASGIGTIAQGHHQTVIGSYNVANGDTSGSWIITNKSEHIFIVGNGTSDSARSNALALTRGGNLTIAGALIGDNVATDVSSNFIPYSTSPFNTGTINAYQVGNLISVRYKLSNVGLNTSTTSALFSIYQNWRPKTENIFQASITDSNYTHIGTGVVRVQTDGWVYLRTPASMSQTTGLYIMFNGVYIH